MSALGKLQTIGKTTLGSTYQSLPRGASGDLADKRVVRGQ